MVQVDAFHQLHCLERIRQVAIGRSFLDELTTDVPLEETYFVRHTLHCIDYLRQTLLCQADLTLVPPSSDLNFETAPPRMCRDWHAVERWVASRRYDLDKWMNGNTKWWGG